MIVLLKRELERREDGSLIANHSRLPPQHLFALPLVTFKAATMKRLSANNRFTR